MTADGISNEWRTTAFMANLVVLSMQDFAMKIIRHVQNGGSLSEESFADIKASCIADLKNFPSQGLPLEDETDAYTGAIESIGPLIDQTIKAGTSTS
jgi:hypothetical protein